MSIGNKIKIGIFLVMLFLSVVAVRKVNKLVTEFKSKSIFQHAIEFNEKYGTGADENFSKLFDTKTVK